MKSKILFIVFCLFLNLKDVNALEIKSKNAVMYNLNTNEIIFDKNSDEVIKIASLTKIMTVILAIESIDNINDSIVITNDMINKIPSNAKVLGFKIGDVVTYKDLIYAAMLPSAADATEALAISVSGDVDSFVVLMNEKARELGLNDTLFTNTSGLDYKDNHSTLKNIATLLKYSLNNETFKEVYKTKNYKITTGINIISNLENEIRKYELDINYIDGSKTGYTSLAGLCLSSIATHNEIEYLLITCGADPKLKLPYNIVDSDKIYKYYFENYSNRNILNNNDILVSISNKYSNNQINILSNIDYSLYMLKDDYNNLKYEYIGLNEIDIFTKEKIIGKYNIKLNDKIIKTIDIYKPDNIEFSVILFISNYIYVPLIILFLLIGVIIYASKKHKSRKLRD